MTAPATGSATGPAPQRPHWHPGHLASLLRSNRLTLLVGEVGAARDALLRRGLLPTLHPMHVHGSSLDRALRFDAWGPLPLQALREQIDRAVPMDPAHRASATLAEHLGHALRRHRVRLLLVLDAFERHLDAPADRADIERFDRELVACINDAQLPLHLLLVVDPRAETALQRYSRWIPDFGRARVRLPAATEQTENQWRDTDIHAGDLAASHAGPGDEADDGSLDDSLDLSLDEPTVAPPSVSPPAPPIEAPAVFVAPSASMPTPVPTPATSAARAPTMPPPPAAAPAFDATRRSTGGDPSSFDAARWAATAASPPWRTEPDAEAIARTQRAPRWWRNQIVRVAADLVALLAGTWLVASWIIGNDRPALRQPTASTQPAAPARDAGDLPASAAPSIATPPTPALPPSPHATVQQPAVPQVSAGDAPPAGAPPTTLAPPRATAQPAATAPPAGPPARRTLAVALAPDAGSAAPMLDELGRLVAAPAGIALSAASAAEPAALTVLRTDALLAMRAAAAQPLRVIAPLFSEQIQVIVRSDAPWDYVHQIKSLRLNVGRGDGARGRTGRALYRELFGMPMPVWAINELDEGAALQQLLHRDGPIDAVIVVSESPVLPQLPAAMRRQLRELAFDPGDRRVGALRTYWTMRHAGDKPRLAVTSFLVALGPASGASESTLRSLAVALCRAQPTLQSRGSALMRGFAPTQQPAVGWPYLLPRSESAGCPADPTPDARPTASRLPERKAP